MAGALRFELRTSGLESDVLPLTLCSRKKLVHTDGLEPPKVMDRLIYSQVQLPLCHICKKETQLSKIKKSELMIPVVESTRS